LDVPIFPGYPRVCFDHGAIEALGEELARAGVGRPLVITDEGLVAHGVVDRLRSALSDRADVLVFDGIPPNPTVAGIEGALGAYRANGCDGIVGLGGGSVLDSGKALRVAVTHERPILDYLEDPSMITADVAPYLTVPTTAGTGAEITSGGGIHPEANAHQLGIRSSHVRPDVAICDPDLTLTLPPLLTAATGMDALAHCLEGYLSRNVNPPADAIALDGITRITTWLERAVANGADREARWHMMMAALEGGMAISMGLGPVHVLGHIFADSPLHHGALIAASTPPVVRWYQSRGDDGLDRKLAGVVEAMGPVAGAGGDLADAIAALNARIGIEPSIRAQGYPDGDVDALAAMAAADRFFNPASPVVPTVDEYRVIVTQALGENTAPWVAG
jgi:alcohol dehydrogenase class IV